ncbi:hypothetical protein ACTG1Y_21505 [Aeromonas veronii]
MVERSVGFDDTRGDQISLQVFDFTGAVPSRSLPSRAGGKPRTGRTLCVIWWAACLA